jgi:hypothetical protein
MAGSASVAIRNAPVTSRIRFGKCARHLVERVGIEHRVPAADKPEIAVEPSIGHGAVRHERRSEP